MTGMTMTRSAVLTLLACAGVRATVPGADPAPARTAPALRAVRVNVVGYPRTEGARALVLASRPLRGRVFIEDGAGRTIRQMALPRESAGAWGTLGYHAAIDLGGLDQEGDYRVVVRAGRETAEARVRVSGSALRGLIPGLLSFLRQQRCGYNPFLDGLCHSFDGRSAYGPHPPGTYVDARGGWHDAADQLKYLLTSSAVVGQLLTAHRLRPDVFEDGFDAMGRPGANGRADVLDEARWGLEWMLRLHPSANELYHQVADDRDHVGWKLPTQETADYGWGPGRERVVYFADGRPQGLGRFASASTGIANLAGRYAAAMALASLAWQDDPRESAFARACLQAGIEVYAMGRAQEGVQQGNSHGAPYRYGEETWTDDMEWGAAELFRATGERAYLDDAMRYGRLAGATSWMGRDEVSHYQFFPFVNLGHFALAEVAPEMRAELAGYYGEGIDKARARAARNPYEIGVPFVWCSNNFVVGLATQIALRQRMTDDHADAPLLAAQRDWLLGRNPWGTAMLTFLPEAPSPRHPHLSTVQLTGRPVMGGLVDGPVAARVFASLKGVTLSGPDPFAAYQGEAVYHDDALDYSTNEPTLDGTASAVLLFALIG
jgi:endoglucanase